MSKVVQHRRASTLGVQLELHQQGKLPPSAPLSVCLSDTLAKSLFQNPDSKSLVFHIYFYMCMCMLCTWMCVHVYMCVFMSMWGVPACIYALIQENLTLTSGIFLTCSPILTETKSLLCTWSSLIRPIYPACLRESPVSTYKTVEF